MGSITEETFPADSNGSESNCTGDDGHRCNACCQKLVEATSAPAVDPHTHKATEIKILSIKRPHMRAFHCSWVSFFTSFFVWFAIIPLLPYIQTSLGLSQSEIFISNVFNLIPTERLIVGPLCDRYGPRKVFLAILCLAAVPTACTGLVNSAGGLYALRFFIGMAGGSFVVCQFWSTIMFAPEIVGQANGFIGGWGNLGGGVTQLVIGTGLMPVFVDAMGPDRAWRTISFIPAAMALVTGIIVYFISDDSPDLGHRFRRSLVKDQSHVQHEATVKEAFVGAATRSATWILFCHYMMSFGIELTMLGTIATYFTHEFGISHESASAIASIFGWMNIFARGMGGWASDLANRKFGMKGRLWVQAICFTTQGLFVLILAFMKSFASAFVTMIFFSIAVQAAEGSTFSIVPFVDKKFPGAVSGTVSSGGNIGGIIFSSLYIVLDFHQIYYLLATCSFVSVPLTLLIKVDEYPDDYDTESVAQNGSAPLLTSTSTNSPALRSDLYFPPNAPI